MPEHYTEYFTNTGTGIIKVYSFPDGADIYIDGNAIGIKTPVIIRDVPEGVHQIIFKMPGHYDEYKMIDVHTGAWSEAYATMRPLPSKLSYMLYDTDSYIYNTQPAPGWPAIPTPSGPYGHIVANTIPDGAEIYLDGQPIYDWTGSIVKTPVTILGISTGVHRVTFRKQGYFDENVDVLIQNGLYSDASAVLRLRMAPMGNSNIFPPLKWYMEPDYVQSYLQPIQRGSVHFDTQPHGAIIMVDGQYIIEPDTEEYIRTPATVLLFEGRRDFVLKLEGHHDISGYIDVFAGSRVDIFRNMEPIPGSNIRPVYLLPYPYYPGYGDILVDSNPQGAYIYIDGYPLLDESGNAVLTPVKVTGVMEGMHEVRIAKDRYYEKQIIVNVISGQTNNAYAKLQSIYE